MTMPPWLMRLKVIDEGCRINLWLPLFLVWILLGALAIILLPLAIIAILVLYPFKWSREATRMVPVICSCVCGLRGLKVDVKNQKGTILIYFI